MMLRYEKDGAVATFTFDNGRMNIFTPQLHKALFEALSDFVSDSRIRVGIMSGAPGHSFSAGDDIKTPLPPLSPAEAVEAHLFPHAHEGEKGLTRPGWEQDVLRLKRYKPIVGAVDGYCLGQGLIYLLLLTDIRLATPRAQFGFPEIAYGMGGAGGTARLGLQIPHVIAMEMLLIGDRIGAERALGANLINRIVPEDRLAAEARTIADKIAAHPPVAVRVEMEAYARAMEMTREQAMDYIGTLFRLQRLGFAGEGEGRVPFKTKAAAK